MLNNNKESLNKFDVKADESIFLDYSIHSKAHRVYNKRTLVVEESVHVTFDEHNSISKKVISDDVDEIEQKLKKLNVNQAQRMIYKRSMRHKKLH